MQLVYSYAPGVRIICSHQSGKNGSRATVIHTQGNGSVKQNIATVGGCQTSCSSSFLSSLSSSSSSSSSSECSRRIALECAWFQPLNLSSVRNLVGFKFAFFKWVTTFTTLHHGVRRQNRRRRGARGS
jgi:hypothetical protein